MSQKDAWDIAFGVVAVVGAVLGAIGTTSALFLRRYWETRDRVAADRAKHRDILYASLKWFEGRTQKRSIGISVVKTSWAAFPEFQPLWLEVLANQAIYLLAASKEKSQAHEHDNLRRIMEMLVDQKKRLEATTRTILRDTIDQKLSGALSSGLTLTPELQSRLTQWRAAL